ncbi:hypothetical protein [Kribbella sp. VKM Ac-2568]|uniref:hypothetical protein n=1 Tax=Kribbella sp. VKM Ac-2568 TaxID=2512219 RepID=UPI0013051471|nr:hypothetical protein [Kribbella sp. VKM Ac-2568]
MAILLWRRICDDIFAELVEVNDEGTVVQVGSHQPTAHVPFTAEVIRELEASGRLRRKRPSVSGPLGATVSTY